MTNFCKKINKWQIQIHVCLKKGIQILFHNIDKNNIQKKKNHLMHSKNKHIYCTILISYYLYIYIYAFHNTLISHNMNWLYNLKVKYFLFILYILLSNFKQINKKIFTYEFWLSRASHGLNVGIILKHAHAHKLSVLLTWKLEMMAFVFMFFFRFNICFAIFNIQWNEVVFALNSKCMKLKIFPYMS